MMTMTKERKWRRRQTRRMARQRHQWVVAERRVDVLRLNQTQSGIEQELDGRKQGRGTEELAVASSQLDRHEA
jgi:hypothetical protein